MAATMYIIGWKAKGLRCPDHEISCCDGIGVPRPVTLIQMPNGTGKTTTLTLLRMALSGSAANSAHNPLNVMELKKRHSACNQGIFELRLLLNDRRVTIVLDFDFEVGRIRYKTTRGSGQVEEFDPPLEFRRFMNEGFVKFFVFDGELADNILSREHTDAQLAVENLFQIHLLGQMGNKVEKYWDDKTSHVTAKDKTGRRRRENNLARWRSRLEKIQEQQAKSEHELRQVMKSLKYQKKLYDSEIKKEDARAKEVQSAEKKVERVEKSVHDSARAMLDVMRDPEAISSVFAESIYDLKMGLDRVKLPESAAKEFFEELANEEVCVCGRAIDEETRVAIAERAAQYLGSDDVALLNSIKGAVDDVVGHSREDPVRNLSDGLDSLGGLVRDEINARNELDALREEAEASDPKVRKAKEEIVRLTGERERLTERLSRYSNSDEEIEFGRIGNINPQQIFSLEILRRGVSLLEEKVDEIAGTLALKDKRDLLNKVLLTAYKNARKNIEREITQETNDRIRQLMPDNMIRVKKIDRCIVLKGQSSGSAGENLAVGYAFLATLFNRSGQHQLPFVVDSPANAIDFDIRPRIGQLVPVLTNQFIGFVISSERERFLPSLRSHAEAEIGYVTLFRKTANRLSEQAERSPECVSTIDGFQVTGEEFFNEFQLDSEEG